MYQATKILITLHWGSLCKCLSLRLRLLAFSTLRTHTANSIIWFKTPLQHLPSAWHWAYHSPSLIFSYFIWKVRMTNPTWWVQKTPKIAFAHGNEHSFSCPFYRGSLMSTRVYTYWGISIVDQKLRMVINIYRHVSYARSFVDNLSEHCHTHWAEGTEEETDSKTRRHHWF